MASLRQGSQSIHIDKAVRRDGTSTKSNKNAPSDNIPIFLSFSKPVFQVQHDFIHNLSEGLRSFGMKPRTLGVTDYDTLPPLTAIKNLISHSAGLISIAFRRTHIETGETFDDSDGRVGRRQKIHDKWLTTPWPHIEVAMAFQIDLPILILRESGVMADGILEKGCSAFYLPVFDLESSTQPYLGGKEWQGIFHKWSRQVRTYMDSRDIPLPADDPPPSWPQAQNSPWTPLPPITEPFALQRFPPAKEERPGNLLLLTPEGKVSTSSSEPLSPIKAELSSRQRSLTAPQQSRASPDSVPLPQDHTREREDNSEFHPNRLRREDLDISSDSEQEPDALLFGKSEADAYKLQLPKGGAKSNADQSQPKKTKAATPTRLKDGFARRDTIPEKHMEYGCKQCSKWFASARRLTQHQSNVHGDYSDFNFLIRKKNSTGEWSVLEC
jgi:hypothetical protein